MLNANSIWPPEVQSRLDSHLGYAGVVAAAAYARRVAVGSGAPKTELQAAFAAHRDQPPVVLAEIDTADPANHFRRVLVSGRYDAAHQILLDNQLREGQPGFHVLTPLRLTDGSAILINRGWVAQAESRQSLPNLPAPAEPVTIIGWLAQPANPGLRMGDAAGSDRRWPRVVLYVDYDRLAAIVGYPLQPALVLLDPAAPEGYRRDWQPRFGGIGPERHQGYAVQWFALAVALVILYLAANLSRSPHSA